MMIDTAAANLCCCEQEDSLTRQPLRHISRALRSSSCLPINGTKVSSLRKLTGRKTDGYRSAISSFSFVTDTEKK